MCIAERPLLVKAGAGNIDHGAGNVAADIPIEPHDQYRRSWLKRRLSLAPATICAVVDLVWRRQ